jgi:hypothetical protein
VRRGTRTARVGALTSATKVVDERTLIVLGTALGEAMAETRTGTCLMTSALGKIPQRVVAALTAAAETYESAYDY